MEATGRIELPIGVLQTPALPLGYVAPPAVEFDPPGCRAQAPLSSAAMALRDVLAALPGGVVVVAARAEGGFRGMTATSFAPVSLEPPLALVSVDALNATWAAIRAEGTFTASLLERGQEFLAERFAGRAPAVSPAWSEAPHRLSPAGLPYLEGAVAWFECETRQAVEAGDHVVVIAAVTDAARNPGEPLVHWDRGFWRLA